MPLDHVLGSTPILNKVYSHMHIHTQRNMPEGTYATTCIILCIH